MEKTFHPGFIEGGIKGRDMLLPISLEPTDLIRSRRGDGSHLRHEMSHLLDRPSGSLTTCHCHCHCLCLCHCLSSSCHLRHGMSHLLDGPSGSSPTCQGQSSGGLKIPFSGPPPHHLPTSPPLRIRQFGDINPFQGRQGEEETTISIAFSFFFNYLFSLFQLPSLSFSNAFSFFFNSHLILLIRGKMELKPRTFSLLMR